MEFMNGKNLYWFSPNFKLQISSIFHQYNSLFSPTKISYSINHRKFFKKYFLKRIFFYGKFNKYPDKRDYPIKGTIERIFHSRSEDSLKSIAKKVVPTLVPLGPILFPGIRERYRRIKKKKNKNKNKKKTKHLWNGNLWYASRKLMLTSAATTQKSFVATPLRSFLSRSFQPSFPVMARVSWNHPYFQR